MGPGGHPVDDGGILVVSWAALGVSPAGRGR